MDNCFYQHLQNCCNKVSLADYPRHSRVHPLNQKPFHPGQHYYVKREDELGFGLCGIKVRKYASLIPFLITHRFQEVIVIGGAYSNNVFSLVQLLIENKLSFRLFLRGEPAKKLEGNQILLHQVYDLEKIVWIKRSCWHTALQLAYQYQETNEKRGIKTMVLEEGCSVAPAIGGLASLALDIICNEKEWGISFDHIFIDAGTAMSAGSLFLFFSYLKKTTTIHVILLACETDAFYQNLQKYQKMVENFLTVPLAALFSRLVVHTPRRVPRFGRVNSVLFEEIKNISRREGFLLDPIYSGKCFIEAQSILKENPTIEGNILIVHSGGSQSLIGFVDKFR